MNFHPNDKIIVIISELFSYSNKDQYVFLDLMTGKLDFLLPSSYEQTYTLIESQTEEIQIIKNLFFIYRSIR